MALPVQWPFADLSPAAPGDETTPLANRRSWKPDGAKQWSGPSPLEHYARYPEKHPQEVLYADDDTVVIYDKYPKAWFHFLVIPRQPVRDIYDLDPMVDIPLVHTLVARAGRLIRHLQTQPSFPPRALAPSQYDGPIAPHHPTPTHAALTAANDKGEGYLADPRLYRFRLGFHTLPSLPQLHLHVISDDFMGPMMKSQSRWNTFATPFLRPPEVVLEELEKLREASLAGPDDSGGRQPARIVRDRAREADFFHLPMVCLFCHKEQPNFRAHRDEHLPGCFQTELENRCRELPTSGP
ncbi:aprataxin-like protein [Tieghemiomyces parasiticus]|uniref:Aprataxin-like protein n=1 Tax=Tieghemiomyces parasiticus TaxID=78921 RepID=A0A9W8A767_9FUNG|nr:aprataxin-like protein [Tieghemiomyces parasiticus]